MGLSGESSRLTLDQIHLCQCGWLQLQRRSWCHKTLANVCTAHATPDIDLKSRAVIFAYLSAQDLSVSIMAQQWHLSPSQSNRHLFAGQGLCRSPVRKVSEDLVKAGFRIWDIPLYSMGYYHFQWGILPSIADWIGIEWDIIVDIVCL